LVFFFNEEIGKIIPRRASQDIARIRRQTRLIRVRPRHLLEPCVDPVNGVRVAQEHERTVAGDHLHVVAQAERDGGAG
jgi:hypothetical protein